MTSRERVTAAIDFTGPDRVPFKHCVLPAAFTAHPGLADLLARYPSDFAGEDGAAPNELPPGWRKGQYTDEWQCTWTVLKDGYIGQVTDHPLSDLSRLSAYRFPDPVLAAGHPGRTRDDRYVTRGCMTLFELMVNLCGFDYLLEQLGLGNPDVLVLRDRIVEYNVALTCELLKQDPDAIYFADDWGTQLSLMIAPVMWREVFLPAYRRQLAPVREAGKHVFFHTDGMTLDILPDLVDAGVNVFWADLTVNPLDRLHTELGGKVCFQALTDVQFTLRDGTPEAAAQHGRDLIAALGSFNGGLIGAHEVNVDQPWENVVAIFQAFHEDGVYPLKLRWTGDRAERCPDR